MTYNIGMIGYKFLLFSMTVDFNSEYYDPGAIFESLTKEKREKYKNSIYNPNFYSRAADEIMKKIFTPEEQEKLQNLIAELKNKEVSLIASASSKVEEIMNQHRSESAPLRDLTGAKPEEIKKMIKGVVVGVFEKIPPYALNLLGLIKINPERFPQSYNLFKEMLDELNEDNDNHPIQSKVKNNFSKALEELEIWAKSIKNKKEETANLGEENTKNENSSNQNRSEGDKNAPTDSNEKPETQNNSENNENTSEPNNDDSPNLQAFKTQAISEITASLNQTPPLTSSDLSSEYQNWENEINSLSDEKKVNFLKTSVLFDIKKQRKEKIKKQTADEVSEIINSNLQKAQDPNATIQDKKEALANSEKYEGRSAYEDAKVKEQTKNLKKEVARDNPTEYRDKIISDLETKLNKNRLTEKELDDEIKAEIEALKKETDPDKLVESEIKITQKIFQQGATKKITNFEKKAKAFLRLGNKTKIDKLKKQMIEFMKSDNVYYQAKKSEVQQILKKLENGWTNSPSSKSLPFSAQIGIGMGAVLVVLFSTLLIWKKKKQMDFFKST